MSPAYRLALLGSAISASTLLASAPAQASCTVAAGSVVCATTTTTNTTNVGATPAVDRNYNVDTSAAAFTGTVSSGALVDGNGLAFTNTVGGTNALNVVNSGAVQVNAGQTPTAGGTAALNVTGLGATPINYSGNGSITNLGTAGDGLNITTSGTGAINAAVGGSVTSAVGGTGINVLSNGTGTTGNILVGTVAGQTVRGDFAGVLAQSLGATSTGSVTINNNASVGSLAAIPNTLDYGVAAQTSGTGGVTVNNTGAVGSATDRVQQFGLYAASSNAGSTGPILVTNGAGAVYGINGILAQSIGTGPIGVTTGTGVINALNTGILVNAGGTNATTVTTGTGAVTASNAAGIGINVAGGLTGPTTITTGGTTSGGAYGIQAATTGTQSITVNGATTGTATAGIHSNTTAARTINVNSGASVTGGTEAILLGNTGTAAINNSGTIGAASTGLALATTGAGAVTLTNNAPGIVNGRLTFNAGNDLFTNAGTFNTQGITDFSAGTDTLNNSGTINLAGNTTFANLETFNNTGTTNLNTFTLTGTGGTFTNAGTVNTTGSSGLAGFTALNNNGTLNLGAGTFVAPTGPFTNTGTINATNGNTSITGQTSFANSGTLNLQDGATNDILTINSSFVGSGNSRLLIDAGGTASDRLVINGAASGLTSVNVADVGGPIIDPTGLLVVDTLTSSANAFVLGANPSTPVIAYRLEQRGADYYLTSGATAAAFEPLTFGLIGQDLWYQSADKYRDMAAGRRGADVSRHNGFGMWADVYASRDRYGDNNSQYTLSGVNYSVDNRVHNKRAGGQIGADYAPGSGPFLVGLTAGYERNKASLDASASDYEAEGYNIGAYAQYAPVTGFYAGLLAKYDSGNLDLNNSVFGLGGTSSPKLKSMGYDGELGYRFGTDAMSFDVNAGLSHVRSKVENFAFGGFGYDYDKITSNRGRIGVRAGFGGGLGAYVGAKLLHEFKGDSDVFFLNGSNRYDLANQAHGTWGRVEAGLDGGRDGGLTTGLWADVGDVKGVGAKVGFRF